MSRTNFHGPKDVLAIEKSSEPRKLFSKKLFSQNVPKTTIHSTSLGKMFFTWHFIFNENILFLLMLSYQKPFVFTVSCFVLKYIP